MKLRKLLVASVVAFGVVVAIAQPSTSEALGTLSTTEIEALGDVLSDVEGRSLYLYLEDEPGKSNCIEACAEAWPPLLTEGEVEATEGLNEELIGTTERLNGTLQVTFNGWPLYYYAEDEDLGDFVGHGVGEVWYLVTDEGEPAGAPAGAAEAAQQEGQDTQQTGGMTGGTQTGGTQTGGAGTTEGSQGQASQTGPSADVTVALSEHAEDVEGFLTDGEGRTLYVFMEDEPGKSNCTGECSENWPPLLTTTGKIIGMGGVAPGLLGTTEREDGSLQVTYIDRPLYYFAQDQQSGDINGQGVGEAWYIASLVGEPIEDVATLEVAEEEEEVEVAPAVLEVGRQVYSQNCVACHGSSGEGGVGVGLAENQSLANVTTVAGTILHGSGEMPAFAPRLSDEEIASVATYIRNSFENNHGPVSVQEVRERR